MAITIISKAFAVAQSIVNNPRSILPIVCGIPESVLSGISDRYIFELTADLGGNFVGFGIGAHEFTVHAYMQEKFVMSSGSDWTSIAQEVPFAETALGTDSMIQATTGRSTVTSVSTQRKWVGSEPISFSLKLKFEAVNDVEKEVLMPCRGLQGLTLPRGGKMGVGLIPPGPSPYTFTQASNPAAINKGMDQLRSRGERIRINIGNFLGFDSVIIKKAAVTYLNRMGADGPVGAEVDLYVESWRMMTREELQDSYTKKMTVTGTNNIGIVG